MASPEEKKKKYFAHVVAILNDSFERALEQDGCICKPLTVKEDCGLRTADCGLWTADCGLRTVDCGLRTADCGLRTADCELRTADRGQRTRGKMQTVCEMQTAD